MSYYRINTVSSPECRKLYFASLEFKIFSGVHTPELLIITFLLVMVSAIMVSSSQKDDK